MPKIGEKIIYRSIARETWPAAVAADRGGGIIDLEVLSGRGTPVLFLTKIPRGDLPGTWAPAPEGA
jgi:hypothetical protein